MAALVRRFKIDGFELEDLIQEGFLAALEWAEAKRSMQPLPQETLEAAIFAHLRRLKKSQVRHSPRTVTIERRSFQGDELYEDDAVARSDGSIDALVLMLAARSECESEEDEKLLDLLSTGAGYRPICYEFHCNKVAARKRVERFRLRLHGRLYPEEVK